MSTKTVHIDAKSTIELNRLIAKKVTKFTGLKNFHSPASENFKKFFNNFFENFQVKIF